MHSFLIRILAGLLACLLLAGCFDIREELWVHRDGSGKAELTYVIPASALLLAGGEDGLEEKIRTMIASQPKLSLDALQIKEIETGVEVSATVSTKSMLSLLDLKKGEGARQLPGAALDIAGNFDVRLQGLDIDFTRTVKVKEALGMLSIGVGKEERETRRLVYILHLPVPPEESNAMKVEDGGKTLKWETTLGEAIKKPVVTSFRARMPIPTELWYSLALVIVALTALVRMVSKWRRKSRMAKVMDAEAG
jgi:hypothetical protein